MTVRESEVRQVIFPDVATNRIEATAARYRAAFDAGLRLDGEPLTVDLAEADRGQDLTFEEWFGYQNTQARAHATGKLSTAEAQTIYIALGGEGMSATGWASHVDLALKLAILGVIRELLEARR